MRQDKSSRSMPKDTQIPIAKKLLRQIHFLLKQLSSERDVLQQKLGSSEVEWQNEHWKIQRTKARLTEILGKFTTDYLNDISKRLDKQRKMRLRKRKQVHRKHQEERLAKDERSKMQKELDKVIATEMKEKEKKKTDAELQKEIDSTLSEVRQKKRDMTQQQNLYRALRKLRLIRQGTMSNSSSHQDGENFESAMTKLEEFVRQRSTMYREEEKTMQVMLEGERTEMVAKEDERTLRKKAIAEEARLKLQKEMLFGEGTLAENASEWNPISRFYNQANENLQCFIDVRRQWDAFISEDQQDATRIPLNWISPAPPSSDKWASAIS
ncbi:uncharacterized protein [Apostichopus japonicus]|uniref:uncharacterized protein n=1 Tax=Stichopus japonicus TaxID=307972 RepID=UPI003AB43A35